MTDKYLQFLASKAVKSPMRGLKRVPELAGHLFPFQAACVDFALRAGCAGIFLDTGLGKTEIQLEWCQNDLASRNQPSAACKRGRPGHTSPESKR